jgi:hypothetical protein
VEGGGRREEGGSALDGPEIVLVEAAVFAAQGLAVQHGGDLARFLFVHELHPAVLIPAQDVTKTQ